LPISIAPMSASRPRARIVDRRCAQNGLGRNARQRSQVEPHGRSGSPCSKSSCGCSSFNMDAEMAANEGHFACKTAAFP
jgi:hypothetical protein